MEIYRLTVEGVYSDEVLQSHFFATKQSAIGYAQMLKEEFEAELDTAVSIIVAAYTPDDGGEFFYNHDIKVYEI